MINRLFAFILLVPFSLCAQETKYFDPDFITERVGMSSYSRTYYHSEDTISFTDRIDGKLFMTATCVGFKERSSLNEYINQYRTKNSNVEKFENSKQAIVLYYKNGKKYTKQSYSGGSIKFIKIWSSKEELVVDSGVGVVKERTEEFPFRGIGHSVYQDSLLSYQYMVRENTNDTIYSTFDSGPEPVCGLPKYYQLVTKKLKYPIISRITGKEGKVLVGFIVDKSGRARDFTLENYSENKAFQNSIYKTVEKLPSWKPAIFRGNPVNTAVVLPITFDLQ